MLLWAQPIPGLHPVLYIPSMLIWSALPNLSRNRCANSFGLLTIDLFIIGKYKIMNHSLPSILHSYLDYNIRGRKMSSPRMISLSIRKDYFSEHCSNLTRRSGECTYDTLEIPARMKLATRQFLKICQTLLYHCHIHQHNMDGTIIWVFLTLTRVQAVISVRTSFSTYYNHCNSIKKKF